MHHLIKHLAGTGKNININLESGYPYQKLNPIIAPDAPTITPLLITLALNKALNEASFKMSKLSLYFQK